jgi:hypothetical protein
MELSHYQYWILDYVLCTVEPLVELTAFLKKEKRISGEDSSLRVPTLPLLDLTIEELAEIVFSLFEMGYISVIDDEGINYLKHNFIPTFGEVLGVLHGTDDLKPYGLTGLGGRIWEDYSSPKWEYYCPQSLYYINHETCFGRLRSTNKTVLDKLVTSFQIIPSCDFESLYWGDPIVPGPVSWEIVANWQPMYWKTLDYVFQIEFQVITDQEKQCVEDKIMTEQEIMDYLFPNHLRDIWYQKYFDIENPSGA